MSNTNGSRKSPTPNGKRSASSASGAAPGEARAQMQITSDEINILVYRYLQEAGFVHSAFTFAYESMIGKSNGTSRNVPPGALISFLQKGLQYVGIEETLRQDGTDRTVGKAQSNGDVNAASVNHQTQDNGNFSLLCPNVIKSLIRKNPPLKLNIPPATAAAAIKARLDLEAKAAQELQTNQKLDSNTQPNAHVPLSSQTTPSTTQSPSNQPQLQNEPHATPQAGQIQNSATSFNPNVGQIAQGKKSQPQQPVSNGFSNNEAAVALASINAHLAMDVDTPRNDSKESAAGGKMLRVAANMRHGFNADPEAEETAIKALIGQHRPQNDAGASQQVDAGTQQNVSQQSITIDKEDMLTRAKPDEVLELNEHSSEVFMCAWNPVFTDLLATGSGDASARIWKMGGAKAKDGKDRSRLLPHGTNPADKKNKDVTTLEWSSNGELLATGSYDGVARVWNRTGAIVHTLRGHLGPIFSLKWNKRGNFLLSGSYDKTTIVWDVSGSTGVIRQQFQHHTAPALDVDWKDNLMFASCSTDKTVLICRVGNDRPLFQFTGHRDEVNAVKWDPTGTLLASCSDDSTAKVWDISSGRSQPLHDFASHSKEIYTVKWNPVGRMLATASFDGSVRLWNVENGSCISVLSRHRDSVYSVAFSPSGDYLASGSLAGQLYIWRVKDGQHIKNFRGRGDIFEVAWNKEETRIAACFSSNVVNVVDFNS